MAHADIHRNAGSGARRLGFAAAALVAAAFAGSAGAAPADDLAIPSERAWRAVAAAALAAAIPPELALAVARAGADAPRASRAIGVMGVNPSVARAEFGVPAHALRDVRANAGIAAALLDRLYRRHGERWDLALSHYRGGPLPTGADGPAIRLRTVDYVAGVMEWRRRYQDNAAAKALIAEVREGASAPRRAGAVKADLFPALVRSPLLRREPVARDLWPARGRTAATGGARRFGARFF